MSETLVAIIFSSAFKLIESILAAQGTPLTDAQLDILRKINADKLAKFNEATKGEAP